MAKLGKKLDKVNKLSKRQAESCIPSPSSPEPQPLEAVIRHLITEAHDDMNDDEVIKAIMQAITAHEQGAIQQFAEKCIEGMPKVHAACTCGQAQYDACIAHIRAMAEKGGGGHE